MFNIGCCFGFFFFGEASIWINRVWIREISGTKNLSGLDSKWTRHRFYRPHTGFMLDQQTTRWLQTFLVLNKKASFIFSKKLDQKNPKMTNISTRANKCKLKFVQDWMHFDWLQIHTLQYVHTFTHTHSLSGCVVCLRRSGVRWIGPLSGRRKHFQHSYLNKLPWKSHYANTSRSYSTNDIPLNKPTTSHLSRSHLEHCLHRYRPLLRAAVPERLPQTRTSTVGTMEGSLEGGSNWKEGKEGGREEGSRVLIGLGC